MHFPCCCPGRIKLHKGDTMMRRNTTSVLYGIIFLAAAVVIFGNSVGWWTVQNYDGWWTVFLIVPGLAGLISYGFNVASTCMVLVGGWLLARAQGWFLPQMADSLVLVIIFLLIGLRLIFGGRVLRSSRKAPEAPVFFNDVKGAGDSSGTVNYSAVFGAVEVSNNSTALYGGTVSAIFGGAKLDLRNAVPVNGAVIEANAIFGGVELYVPLQCRIRLEGVPFLGGAGCKAQCPDDQSLPLLTVRYTAVCGGVELK